MIIWKQCGYGRGLSEVLWLKKITKWLGGELLAQPTLKQSTSEIPICRVTNTSSCCWWI